MKYDFEHYLMAGHGRAYMIAKADPERYREKFMAAERRENAAKGTLADEKLTPEEKLKELEREISERM